MHRRVRTLLVTMAIVGAAACIAGCTADQGGDAAVPTASSSPTATPTPSPTRTPTPSPTPTPTQPVVERPATVVDGGTVAGGAPVTVSGTGPSTIAFVRDGDFNTVATLDCAGCTGTAVLTGPDRQTPFSSGAAPYTASVMVEVFENDPPAQELWLDTDGAWTLELRSWNDLEPQYGTIEGTHSAVLFLGDQLDAFDLTCEPIDGDSCSVRAFSAVDTTELGPDSSLFGGDEAFTEHVELRMPGIVTIRTNGAWSITPSS